MADSRPAPYPADTRAKGWRFELDLERIEQSDTWALAAPDIRPWLFLLWAKSWQQVPCGSLPNDDALIAARIGMAPKAFSKARAVLLRGWWAADDGRLYHDVIGDRVRSMLDAKRKESDRKAAYRAKMDAERGVPTASAPPLSHGTTTGLPPPSTVCDGTGTRTSTGTRRKEEEKGVRKRAAGFDAGAIELPDWLNPEVWAAWVKDRKARGKPITEAGAAEQLKTLADYRDIGHDPGRVIRHAIASGHQGLFPPPRIALAPRADQVITTVNSRAADSTAELLRRDAEHRAEVARQRAERIAKEHTA